MLISDLVIEFLPHWLDFWLLGGRDLLLPGFLPDVFYPVNHELMPIVKFDRVSVVFLPLRCWLACSVIVTDSGEAPTEITPLMKKLSWHFGLMTLGRLCEWPTFIMPAIWAGCWV